MKTMQEHFNHLRTSTLFKNYNTGQAIDPNRFRLDQKREAFSKIKKIEPHNLSDFAGSNYGKIE
jgi:hypothetical protein|tara:strand:+ start:268 stop:459 length:192 start_codon:yes stop_codon:yes gene_type:complete